MSVPGVIIHDANFRKRNAWSWKEWGYIVCSCLIILYGVVDILIGLGAIPSSVGKLGGSTYFEVIGAFEIAMGAALLSQIEWVQFLMKYVCIISILNTGTMLLKQLSLASVYPVSGWQIGATAFQLVFTCFTLYFILDMADV